MGFSEGSKGVMGWSGWALFVLGSGCDVVLCDVNADDADCDTVDDIFVRADNAAESACDFAYHADAIAANAAKAAIPALVHATLKPAAACARCNAICSW